MPYEFKMRHRVQFAETDMAGIVHFSNFFRYMENTEHAFFRSLGLSVNIESDPEGVGWPRVHAACDYKRPLRFEEEFEVHLRVRAKKEKSLTYEFLFRKVGEEAEPPLARGTLTVVCITRNPETGTMKAVSIPERIASRIELAPEEQ
jgi:YbgC/YbaW family acyl-CoA thioester hydrolase